METFGGKLTKIRGQVEAIRADVDAAAERALPGSAYFLDEGDVLAFPRNDGDSRYPYGQDGLNFWAYASGYMHCNEGLFSLFLRAMEGQEPTIAFFAGIPRDDGDFTPLPILPVPILNDVACAPSQPAEPTGPGARDLTRYSVLAPTAAYYVAECDDLVFAVRVFVSTQREICFSVLAENQSDQAQAFFLSSFLNPYLRHQLYESGEDRWFREVRVMQPAGKQGELGSFVVKVNEDKDREMSVSHFGVIRRDLSFEGEGRLVRHEETASRYQYVGGSRSSLHTPASLYRGTFGAPAEICAFTETAIVGDMLHLELRPGASARLDIVLRCTDDCEEAARAAAEPVRAEELDSRWTELQERDRRRHGRLVARVGGGLKAGLHAVIFNTFFEHLKRQVEFCALIKGYVQLAENSLIGVRDVFQAIEALVFWEPGEGRRKMIEALGYTAPNGRCFRQYSLPSGTGEMGRMDLRPFIDQGAWVISCVATYVRVTGDLAFLDETCGYHEIVDENAGSVRRSQLKDTVMAHLVRIMDYLLDHRDMGHTRCVRALYGDWNDALDGLGVSEDPSVEYGTGVSVMATLQAYQNALEMVELLEAIDGGRYADVISKYRDAARDLEQALKKFAVVENEQGEKRVLHGWGDGRSYLVGSFKDPDGQARDGLASNAFWALSGMCDTDQEMRSHILAAFRRLDGKYGLKTFEPFFPDNTPGVGRIPKLPPGTAENAATYIHATAFGIMALFRMGCPREAWDQLLKILPFTDIHEKCSHSPFVIPNSYGHNVEKGIDGESMNDWQTGSSNVVLKVLVRYVFGLEPAMGGLWIQPASWSPFESFEFEARVRDCDVRVEYERRGAGRRSFTVNGSPAEGQPHQGMGIERLWVPADRLKGFALVVRVED